ncbi:MAG: acetate--CoA ligase family protein [Gammaproteobacteria bacterium]|nr:acetate--CoA ligase family protein [Gammaproteobacteria bacterium]
MPTQDALRRLFAPRTIAMFGGNSAAEAITQCRKVGFDGEIWAVNPKRSEINGVRCYASIAELPAAPDASFVAAPPAASIEIIRELAASGAGGAVCFAAGFAELGAAGAGLQQELRDAAGDMPVVGPNCHGFLNYLDGVALWPDQHGGRRVERGIALVTQSGNLGINLSMQQRDADLAYVITIGNKTCLGIHDYIEFLVRDPRVTAIGLHIESIDRVHEFSLAAIAALEAGIPIVAIKTGRSARGAAINLSHTASLAGEDRLYEALFRRLGVARCHTLSQFLETLKFVSTVGALPEATLGSMSCSGGEASLIADCADAVGLDMPPLSPPLAARLLDILGPKVPLSNPLDYHTYAWGDREKLRACFSAMLEHRFGCTVLVLDYPLPATADTSNWVVAENALTDAVRSTGQRAVIVATLPETMPAPVRARLKAAGITPMQGLEDCLFAIRAAATIGRAQARVAEIRPVLQPADIGGDPVMLNEWQSKKELAGAGIAVPNGRLARRNEVDTAASALGFPVVLKVVSTELAHKSEAGAVAINLRDSDEVRAAADRMAHLAGRFLIEQMVGPTVAEIIIGVNRDPGFGLTLLVGAGGTLVELLDDTVSLLLPASEQEIRDAIGRLRAARLIDSYRGGEAGDMEALVAAVKAVAAYAVCHNATLVELDVNPLIVLPRGAVAVDALVRRRPGGPERMR